MVNDWLFPRPGRLRFWPDQILGRQRRLARDIDRPGGSRKMEVIPPSRNARTLSCPAPCFIEAMLRSTKCCEENAEGLKCISQKSHLPLHLTIRRRWTCTSTASLRHIWIFQDLFRPVFRQAEIEKAEQRFRFELVTLLPALRKLSRYLFYDFLDVLVHGCDFRMNSFNRRNLFTVETMTAA